jgi:hypothetical protein
MMLPAETTAEARRLRTDGKPYKRIAAALGVSPDSVFRWTSDIGLSAEQLERSRRGPKGPQNPGAQRRRAAAWSARCRAVRAGCQEDGRIAARQGDPLHLMGCMLYWAEGAKSRNVLKLTNSDPAMLRLFRRFLTEALAVEVDETLCINAYTTNGLSISGIEAYWLALLDLPRTSVRKHMVNHFPTSSSGRAKRKLPYGVCTLVVHSTWMHQHIYGAIQEYAGSDEPAWLH